jgi:uncharacterized protein
MNSYAFWAMLCCIYTGASIFSGLSGFGFAAIGSLSLLVLPPTVGVPLLMALSLLTQMASLVALRKELFRRQSVSSKTDYLLPYLIGGMIGLPCGLVLLSYLEKAQLLICLGALLVAYAAYSLCSSRQPLIDQKAPFLNAIGVGAAGGLIGGFSAFPGAALVVWNGLRGASKEESRALTQPYILFMQVIALVLLYANSASTFSSEFWRVLLVATPLALIGNFIGVNIYKQTGDIGYRKITLAALGFSGLVLIVKTTLI